MPGHFYNFSIHSILEKTNARTSFSFHFSNSTSYRFNDSTYSSVVESFDLKLTVADLEILQFRTLELEIFKLHLANSKYREYRATLFSLLDRDLLKYKWKVRGLVKVKVLKSDRTVQNDISRLNHLHRSRFYVFLRAQRCLEEESIEGKYRRNRSSKPCELLHIIHACAYKLLDLKYVTYLLWHNADGAWERVTYIIA